MSETQTSRSSDVAASGAERRGAERFACDLSPQVSEWGAGPGESSLARVRDVSATGLGMVTPACIRPGRVLVLKLTSDARGLSRPLLVRIIHSTQQADGNWLSGGAFVRPLTEEELDPILDAGRVE